MSGFSVDVDGKKISFTYDGRTVANTDDNLVNLLPDLYEDTVDAVFPDVPKGKMYVHAWDMVARSPTTADGSEWARAHVTALPQEWSTETNLVAIPADVDFFAGRVRLNRIVSPSHPWLQGLSNLPPMVKTNVWIPLTGSFLLEQSVGFVRALSIYVAGGYLKLHQQQSVGPAPGGWGPWGAYGEITEFSADTLSSMFPAHIGGGSTVVSSGGQGWPLWYGGDVAPYYRSDNYTAGSGYFIAVDGYYRQNNNFPGYMRYDALPIYDPYKASTTDPTNMSSTWQVEISGRFGRRS